MIALQEMIKTSTPPLIYTTQEELKTLLAKGVIINMGKTWFSLNKKGQNCVMISAAECMIPLSNTNIPHSHDYDSRFARGSYLSLSWKFKIHIQTQFLSPKIVYTVNLVFKIIKKNHPLSKQSYGAPRYVTIGENPSFLYFADEREDGWLTTKLHKFTSEGRYADLEIIFGSLPNYDSSVLVVEGIEFQPLEKVDHDGHVQGITEKLYLFFGRGFPIKYVEGITEREYALSFHGLKQE
ncbi:hypothetical protein E3N88_00813 [Mikania micrantha]|uniref:Uncharacterized protein n=1 Tax=Mikania micrantha TaxID=192012 RepID=A0A5N6Q0K8_9ASTR|nr:hypothetical protein E3N88_00813 [Mikania micrantha]